MQKAYSDLWLRVTYMNGECGAFGSLRRVCLPRTCAREKSPSWLLPSHQTYLCHDSTTLIDPHCPLYLLLCTELVPHIDFLTREISVLQQNIRSSCTSAVSAIRNHRIRPRTPSWNYNKTRGDFFFFFFAYRYVVETRPFSGNVFSTNQWKRYCIIKLFIRYIKYDLNM